MVEPWTAGSWRAVYNRPVLRLSLSALAAIAGIACSAPAPRPEPPREPEPPTADAAPARPVRADLPTEESPTSLVVSGGALLWTDMAGGVWSRPADGSGEPRQLSDQKRPGFAFHLFTAGREVLATSRGDLLRVGVPGGPVTLAKIRGLVEYPIGAVADGAFIYLTMFKRPEIMRVPIEGGTATKL